MTVKIETGGVEVITAGSFITYDESPVVIRLSEIDSPGSKFSIRLTFTSDEGDKTARSIRDQSDDSNEYALKLVNFNNVLGQGVVDPILIASNGAGTQLYLSLVVYSFSGRHNRKVSYSVYKKLREKGG